METYTLKFLFEGKEIEKTTKARSFAHANAIATQYAINMDFPSHILKITK